MVKNCHNCWHFEYNGAAVLAAPTIAYRDMFTMCDECTLGLEWCSKQKNIEKGEVRLTVSSTTPIRLNNAYSIDWSERKRKQNYFKMVAILKY